MFIRALNLGNNREIDINAGNIVLFEPSDNEGTSRVELTNGRVVTINLSNEQLRQAVDDSVIISGEPASPEA